MKENYTSHLDKKLIYNYKMYMCEYTHIIRKECFLKIKLERRIKNIIQINTLYNFHISFDIWKLLFRYVVYFARNIFLAINLIPRYEKEII